MNMFAFLIFLSLVVLLWQESLRVRESAIGACRKICEGINAQLLDETVALASITLRRDEHGLLRIMRRYNFEISPDGVTRHGGYIVLLGDTVVHTEIQMPDGPVLLPDRNSITRH